MILFVTLASQLCQTIMENMNLYKIIIATVPNISITAVLKKSTYSKISNSGNVLSQSMSAKPDDCEDKIKNNAITLQILINIAEQIFAAFRPTKIFDTVRESASRLLNSFLGSEILKEYKMTGVIFESFLTNSGYDSR